MDDERLEAAEGGHVLTADVGFDAVWLWQCLGCPLPGWPAGVKNLP